MTTEDDAYRRAAEVVFNHLREMAEFSQKMQAEYGKWLVSSLLFLHGAAIGGLVFKASGSPPPYLLAIWWFVFGIFLALATGFAAWWNFTFAANQFYSWADYRMLTDRAHWPKPPGNPAIGVTMWVAIVTGILSVICLLIGAAQVVCSWR